MVGILLITHNGLGDSLLDCVRHVTGSVPLHLGSLSVLADDDPQQKEEEGGALIKLLDTGDGVLLLTDIFGATPSNIAQRLCRPGHVEGVAGVNLPMLLRMVCGSQMPLSDMAQRAIQGGQDCIVALNTEAQSCADCG
ncbi:MAG: PTS fructose transporter subunit IIA [Gallionellales bacterium 35-53-114]|jgi:PTS system ascorbate-specific IIA component|nr:MAG: PTS fructose transporter subunit IIA [Gallionellales bacterium 35-53-114]OYZ63532.1 MAG: PTS fructose transporter subunit IIA [Gallionellales bacterium 24-53-125]OZB10858.1 MAG: PTS fructose transporter subunit IIA [Gallionellales bacterium 39-52-133]HQS58967.1 PTS fructose transporter subunit IIA [Gallionellaceae bacterium]HQS75648.1 PTS fructose transporter subunit IIA [Gallionellaceae bacterium]